MNTPSFERPLMADCVPDLVATARETCLLPWSFGAEHWLM